MGDNNFWIFTDAEKALVSSLAAKGKAEQARNEQFAIIDFASFYKLFSDQEVALLKKFLAIDPQSLGYKLPFLGVDDDVPQDLVALSGQSFMVNGQAEDIPCQYLPRTTYDAYLRLNAALEADIHKKLLVLYGYRSPARQVFIFFDILERIYAFDFAQTIQRVCFPDYSEHVCTKRQAIDFKTSDGTPSELFDTTDEYAWLVANAAQFGFYLSYPKDNQLGMMYEPWHWHQG